LDSTGDKNISNGIQSNVINIIVAYPSGVSDPLLIAIGIEPGQENLPE